MSDNTSAPVRTPKASLLLPCAALALTIAAMAVGAPSRIAKLTRGPGPLVASLEFDASIRYEPVISTDPGDYRLVAARRVLDHVAAGSLIAFK